MAEAAGALVDRWAALDGAAELGRRVAVVPAPSGWVRRARGLLVVAQLAEAVAATLAVARPGTVATVADVLRRPGTGHLAGLGVGARAASRTASALRVCPAGGGLLGAGRRRRHHRLDPPRRRRGARRGQRQGGDRGLRARGHPAAKSTARYVMRIMPG